MRVLIQPCPAAIPSLPPRTDEVHIWVADFDRPPCTSTELAACLTPDERDRAARYRLGPVQEQFTFCRGLLRRLLGGVLCLPPHAVPITYAANGKPVLAGVPLHFNVTHTAGLALVAVSGRRVGVDAERVRAVSDADGLVRRFFSPAEREAYRQLPDASRPDAFYRAWVCKEAVIKAAGASMQNLDGFDVEMDPNRPPDVLAARHPVFRGEGWAVGYWEPAPGFVAAVAVEGTAAVQFER